MQDLFTFYDPREHRFRLQVGLYGWHTQYLPETRLQRLIRRFRGRPAPSRTVLAEVVGSNYERKDVYFAGKKPESEVNAPLMYANTTRVVWTNVRNWTRVDTVILFRDGVVVFKIPLAVPYTSGPIQVGDDTLSFEPGNLTIAFSID